jgi:hypothetical protein
MVTRTGAAVTAGAVSFGGQLFKNDGDISQINCIDL